jgi:hypothetical protein
MLKRQLQNKNKKEAEIKAMNKIFSSIQLKEKSEVKHILFEESKKSIKPKPKRVKKLNKKKKPNKKK